MAYGSDSKTSKEFFYSLTDRDMDGNDVSMAKYAGSVLCVVNVASKWGLTEKNYTEFNQLLDDLGPKGFKVLAFPCNQFGGQEPWDHDGILKFVEEKFPGLKDKTDWFEKGDVNGSKSREVFSFLKQKLSDDEGIEAISWNFTKFLIDRDGNACQRFGPKTSPLEFKDRIEELLEKKMEDANEKE